MVIIKPFRGIRYNPKRVNLSRVVTPPYDVISDEEQERYYTMHEFNIIRLDHNKSRGEEKYLEAAKLYTRWKEEQVLIQDDTPALYYCHQEYEVKGEKKTLRGLIALVKLNEYSAGEVLPHEETLSSPKKDRLALLRHTKASFSQIFGLYEDPNGKVTEMVEEVLEDPLLDFFDSTGKRHRMWRITDKKVIKAVARAFTEKRIFIADGHHRYETALAYRDEMRQLTGKTTGNEPFDYVAMYLSNMYNGGVTILPAHRAIKHDFSMGEFLEMVREYFDILKFGRNKEAFFRFLYGDGRNFGFYRGNFYGLVLKDYKVMDRLLPQKSRVFRRLSVSVLHSLILEKILGFTCREDNIAYIIDEKEAIAGVDQGEFTAAFFLNPTKVEEIRDVALRGEKMPGKATYFYPKLLTGLVIYDLRG